MEPLPWGDSKAELDAVKEHWKEHDEEGSYSRPFWA